MKIGNWRVTFKITAQQETTEIKTAAGTVKQKTA